MKEDVLLRQLNMESKKWSLVEISKSLVAPLSLLIVLTGLIVLLGYFLKVESIYRPIPQGAATNPLTALLFVCIGYSLRTTLEANNTRKSLHKLAAFIAFSISLITLLDFILQSNMNQVFTPFENIVLQELSLGKENAIGANTALMFF